MIESVDQTLKAWLGTVFGNSQNLQISFGPPLAEGRGRGVGMYLMELGYDPPPRSVTRTSKQIALRYVVTAWAETPEEAHHLLGVIVFAAMDHPDFEVQLDPIPVATWLAFGVAPRPAFTLQVGLRHEREAPRKPLVKKPPALQQSPLGALAGRVVMRIDGVDMPLMGARVELPSFNLAIRTDAHGHFRFPAVPLEPRVKRVRVRAKNRELWITTELGMEEKAPLVIHFPTMED